MNVILSVIIITAISGIGGTGTGGVISTLFKRDSSKVVSLLLSFAAGIMISIVTLDLISGAIDNTKNLSSQYGLLIVIGGVLFGYFVVYILNYFIDKYTNKEVPQLDSNHPKTADSLDELTHANHLNFHANATVKKTNQLFTAGLVMAAAIALHNMPEGMVIGASFANSTGTEILSKAGITMAVIIGLHDIPEGMAIAVPLYSGGMKPLKVILLTALTGAPTVLGAVIGYYLGTVSPIALSLSLAFASGAMLYVVFGELLPESILMWRSKLPAFITLIGMLVGMVIIYL